MELTFEKDELLYALQMVQGVVGGRNTLPILSNVLIRAENGHIELTTTDLEVAIKVKVDGTITEEGAITVFAKKLADIVRELPENQTIKMVTTANNRIELTCGNGVYKIIGISDEDFPQIPTAEGEGPTIDGATLCSIIHKTEFAASREEFRHYLNGLYFNLQEDKTEVVATDAIRHLALAHCAPFATSEEGTSGFIVPLKAVKEIERIFSDSSSVKILQLNNQILFSDENATLTTRLVEGEYPPYQSVIPETSGHVLVSKESILRAARRVSLLSNPKNFSITLEIEPEQIRISTKTPELGEALETLAVESGNGSVRLGVDARVLTEVIAHIESESVILEFDGEFTQFIVKPQEDDGHICVIMPMRLEASPPSDA